MSGMDLNVDPEPGPELREYQRALNRDEV